MAVLVIKATCHIIDDTANTGASSNDVLQSFIHVAIYAGVPKAKHTVKLAKQTCTETGVGL